MIVGRFRIDPRLVSEEELLELEPYERVRKRTMRGEAQDRDADRRERQRAARLDRPHRGRQHPRARV